MEREKIVARTHGERAPGTAAVRLLKTPSGRARIDRLRMLRVEHERAHVCALEAGRVPACAAVVLLKMPFSSVPA